MQTEAEGGGALAGPPRGGAGATGGATGAGGTRLDRISDSVKAGAKEVAQDFKASMLCCAVLCCAVLCCAVRDLDKEEVGDEGEIPS